MAFVLDVNLRIQQIIGLEKAKAQITGATTTGSSKPIASPVKEKDVKNVQNLGKAAVVTGAQLTTASAGATKFGQQIFLAGKRYLAFVAATAVPLAIFAALVKSTQAVIEFDKEMNDLSQILQGTEEQLSAVRTQILDLAASTGTSREEISSLAKTLAQTGLEGEKLAEALSTLAKVPLVATFEDSASATQTFLAAINQFTTEGLTAEILFDKLTAVSKEFAVSAEDLGEAFKKAGGAFSAIGGDADELIAAFTAIRSVTRETASTVATSLKTMVARLRDLKRIEFIEDKLAINIRDANGALLPFLDTIKRIKPAFEAASTETKALIATSLGGFRQISRVFAILSDVGIATFTKALETSRNSSKAFSKDAAEGLETISAKLGQLAGELGKVIQSLSGPVFIPLIEGAVSIAKSFAGIAQALGPVLPLMLQFVGLAAGVKLLAGALKLIPGTLKAITGINIAGALGGIRGIGKGGAAGGPTGGAGFAGQLIPIPETRKAKAAMLGVANAGKRLIASSTGQLIALGATTVALNALQGSAEEAGNAGLAMALSVAKVITGLTLLTTVLTGRTVQDLTRAFGGLRAAAGLAAGALIIGITIQGAIRASEIQTALEEKVKEAVSKINVDFSASGGATLEQASGELIGSVAKSIEESIKAVDPSTFGGLFTSIGNRLNDFLAGIVNFDLGTLLETFTAQTIGDREIQGFVDAALADEGNREKFREILGEAINKFGSNFEEELIKSAPEFVKKLTGVSLEGEEVTKAAEAFLNAADRLDFASAQEKAVRLKIVEQHKKIVDKLEIVAEDLGKLSIPTTLTSELSALSVGVKATVDALDLATRNFDSFAGLVGGLAGPTIEEDVTPKAATRALIDVGFDLFDTSVLSAETEKLARFFAETVEEADKFFKALEATNIPARLRELKAGTVEASNVITGALDKFLDNIGKDLSPKMEATLRLVVQDLLTAQSEAFEQGEKDFDLGDGLFDAIEKRLGPLGPEIREALEVLAQNIETGAESVLRKTNLSAKQFLLTITSQQEAARTTGKEVPFLIKLFKELGIAVDDLGHKGFVKLGTSITDLRKKTEDNNKKLLLTNTARQRALEKGFTEAFARETAAANKLDEARRKNSTGIEKLAKDFTTANEETTKYRVAIDSFNKTIGQTENIEKFITVQKKIGETQDQVSERTKKTTGIIKQELDIRKQATEDSLRSLKTIVQETQVEAAVAQGDVDIDTVFSDAVRKFDKTVDKLIGNISSPDVGIAAKNDTDRVLQPTTVTIKSDGVIRIDGKDIGKELADIVQKIGFGATLEEADQALRQAALEQVLAYKSVTTHANNTAEELKKFVEVGQKLPSGQDILGDLSPERVQAALQRALAILEEKFGTDLASAFTLGTDKTQEAIFTNLQNRFDSLLGENITVEIKIPDDVRKTIEGGIKTEGGGTTDVAAGQLFVEKITPAVEALQKGAQQFQENNQTFRQASETLGLGADDMGTSAAAMSVSAAESLTAATELRGAVALLNQGVGGEQQTQKFDEFRQIQEEAKQAIETSNQLLEELTKSVDSQTAVIETQQDEPIEVEIEGLEANTSATVDSNETVSTNTSAVENLDDRLQKTNANIAEGIDLKIDAVQELNVNIKGLEGAIETLKPQFAEVATLAAERVVAAALAQLAAAAGDHESRTNFQNTADGLG